MRQVRLKFSAPSVPSAETAAAIEPFAGAKAKVLTFTYFDTPSGALRRANMALCVCSEDDRHTQALKEGSESALASWDWASEVASPEPDLDVLRGVPAGRRLARLSKLAPAVVVGVRRRAAHVVEAESQIELAFDECATRVGGKEVCFTELELRLKSGPQRGLFALADRLATSANLTPSFITKAERALMLAYPARSSARKFAAPPLTRGMTSAEAFRSVALACLRQIAANAEGLRHRADPELIHQMRVGLRRLRSLMSTFRKVAVDGQLPAIKTELKWITGELDAARNLDVLLHRLYHPATQKDGGDGSRGLRVRLRAARRMAYVRASGAVESDRFRRLLCPLLAWIEGGPWTVAQPTRPAREQAIERLAIKELRKHRRKVAKCADDFRRMSPKDRHKLRIEAKKLRYAADVFLSLFVEHPKRAKAFMARLEKVQDLLGELNDIVVGERLAHDADLLAGAPRKFVAGRVTGALKARVAPLVDGAEAALESFAQARPFWN